jgi:hypothetical protein
MNMNGILQSILSLEGATMCRQNKTNFVAIPTEDGIVKVNVSVALAKDTQNHKAFNFEASKAEYKAYVAEVARKEAEKASKPVKVKGVNPEAQARRDAIDKAIADMPSFTDYTATDVMNALTGVIAENTTVMAVGSSAMRMVEKGVLSVRMDEKGKKFYTKA